MALSKQTLSSVNATDVPNTNDDMDYAFMWRKGNEDVEGTFAKSIKALSEYRKDIDNAPNQKDYKPIYIDTANEKKRIWDQLKEFKK